MNNAIARILLISDLHKLSVPVGQQKGQTLTWLGKITEGVINIWKRWNIKHAIPRMVRKIFLMVRQRGTFDLQIINGDVIECEFNERGMTREADLKMMRKTLGGIPSGVPLKKTYVVPGDHELGYRLPLSSDPHGGISAESIENFSHVVGPLWQDFTVGDYQFLLLSSSLMMQKTDHLPKGEQRMIEQLCLAQQAFIREKLSFIVKGKTVFIFMHDPDALVEFHEYIREYPSAYDQNFVVFCGHMHAELSLRIYEKLGRIARSRYAVVLPDKIQQWAKNNTLRLELFKRYNLEVIPAPGGMMGLGGGFKVLDIYEGGFWATEAYKV